MQKSVDKWKKWCYYNGVASDKTYDNDGKRKEFSEKDQKEG